MHLVVLSEETINKNKQQISLLKKKHKNKLKRKHPIVQDIVWLDTQPTPICTYPGNIFFYYFYAAYFEYPFFWFMKGYNWIN